MKCLRCGKKFPKPPKCAAHKKYCSKLCKDREKGRKWQLKKYHTDEDFKKKKNKKRIERRRKTGK